MVTKDVSRFLVQTPKHYTGARLQQGRVVLDSDFNEGVELAREDQRRVMVDVIGPAGSPDAGFSLRRPLDIPSDESDWILRDTVLPVVPFGAHTNDTPRDVHSVALRAGSLYAGGLRFDLDADESLLHQRDYLQLRPGDLPNFTTGQEARYLYYLRAWEQSVGALEDQELREVMLGGGDTSLRVRRMRRVQVFDLGEAPAVNCDEAWAAFTAWLASEHGGSFDPKSFEHRSAGRLRLTFAGGEAEDSCAPCDPFGKRYLGAENQTLRILLTSASTFVWTLDDPKLFRIRVLGLDGMSPLRVELLDPPSDERDWPFMNRVVEIVPFGALLEGADVPGTADPHYRKLADEVGVFTRALQTYDPQRGTFEIEPAFVTALQELVHRWPDDHPYKDQLNVDESKGVPFYMRVWHQAADPSDITLSTTTPPVLGTTGIQPIFTDGQRGDYWIAALRPGAPKEVVPFELLSENGAPPAGPKRYYAPLAFLTLDGDTVVSADDCRPRIRPLNNRLCTRYSVGDGIHSFGDFSSISDAVRALPKEGGTISVGPGVYSEIVLLQNLNDVVIEGCGPSTVVRDSGVNFGSVFEFFQCQRVQLRGFAIQAVQRAVNASSPVSDIVLEDLEIDGGDFGGAGGAFRRGRSAPGVPAISFIGSQRLTLRNVTLRPSRQQGVSLRECANVTIEGMKAFGSKSLESPFEAPPMLELIGTDAVRVRDSLFRVYTQTGISLSGVSGRIPVRCDDVEFTGLDIEAGGQNDEDFIFSPILAPFDCDDGVDVRLRSSVIRMHRAASHFAAVTVRGTKITVEDNRLEVDNDPSLGTLAWGGVQVRGTSSSVVIRNNHITGGAGHGITLGGVIWRKEGQLAQRGAPGHAQLTWEGETGVVTGSVAGRGFDTPQGFLTFTSADEGPIFDVLIADNRIEGFSTNGISSLTVIGLIDQVLSDVSRIRIERNLIRDNVRHPYSSMGQDRSALPLPAEHAGEPFLASQFLQLPFLPLGGIVLTSGRNIEIVDNVIIENGQTERARSQPVSGIFLLTGDAISIEGNRIAKNGHRLAASDPALPAGIRAGVGVMLAGAATIPSNLDNLEEFLFQPSDSLDNRAVALRVVNNTIIQPEGRALHAVAAGPVSVDGNYLASQGNHGADYTVGDVTYVQNLGAPWETFEFSPPATAGGLTGSEYEFEDTPHLSPIMLRGDSPPSPRWFTGLGGGILFVNNQVVYDWTVARLPSIATAPLSFFPNVLLGLDHTTVAANQFAVRLEGYDQQSPPQPPPHPQTPDETPSPLYATLLAAGVTVNIELNRFSETIHSTFLSLLANGDVLNITALNESTHRLASLVTRRDTRMLTMKDNLILIQPSIPIGYEVLVDIVKPSLQEFLRLTFRPPH